MIDMMHYIPACCFPRTNVVHAHPWWSIIYTLIHQSIILLIIGLQIKKKPLCIYIHSRHTGVNIIMHTNKENNANCLYLARSIHACWYIVIIYLSATNGGTFRRSAIGEPCKMRLYNHCSSLFWLRRTPTFSSWLSSDIIMLQHRGSRVVVLAGVVVVVFFSLSFKAMCLVSSVHLVSALAVAVSWGVFFVSPLFSFF